jgi:serine/threonine-protein kinase
VTLNGTIAGSPSYIAPEAWKGDPLKLDHRIDIYALGAIAFRALTGKPPFTEANMLALARDVTMGPRPSLIEHRPDLSPELDFWVKQSLAIDPEERFCQVRGQFNALKWALGA